MIISISGPRVLWRLDRTLRERLTNIQAFRDRQVMRTQTLWSGGINYIRTLWDSPAHNHAPEKMWYHDLLQSLSTSCAILPILWAFPAESLQVCPYRLS